MEKAELGFSKHVSENQGVNRCYMEKASMVKCIWEKLGSSRQGCRAMDGQLVEGLHRGAETMYPPPKSIWTHTALWGASWKSQVCRDIWEMLVRVLIYIYIYSGALYSVLIRETIVLKSFFKNFLVAQTTV